LVNALLFFLWKSFINESGRKILVMKKLFTGLFVLGMLQCSNAQTKAKADVKFTPPVIEKNATVAKPVEKVKFTPPRIVKDEVVETKQVKFTPPVIKKNKPHKKAGPVKFTPPVIVKDEANR